MITNDIKIICLESEAFHKLIAEVISRMNDERKNNSQDQWIDDDEAMSLLKIGKTTLAKYRSEGHIRFSQIGRKVILYDRFSILKCIEKNTKEPY